MILQGRVLVDGKTAQTGMQIQEGQKVELDGKPVVKKKKERITLIAVNKPRGIVCSEVSQGGDQNIIEFLDIPEGLHMQADLTRIRKGCF